MLAALGLEGKIKIAFDEWNLRSWHHPNVHTIKMGEEKESYITPRNKNDENDIYTMADAVFAACFLNAMHRHCDVVGMANFAPILNTRGCIFSHDEGVVLRSTYHVFDLYVNHLGDTVVDLWKKGDMPLITVPHKYGGERRVECLDLVATTFSDRSGLAVAAVNKDAEHAHTIAIPLHTPAHISVLTLNGESKDSYNDVGHDGVFVTEVDLDRHTGEFNMALEPHSVNILRIELEETFRCA